MSWLSFGSLWTAVAHIQMPSSTNLRRAALVSASLAGIISLIYTALNFRRKRRKCKIILGRDTAKDFSSHQVKRSKPSATSTATSSPSSVKLRRRMRRRRRSSLNNSITSSSAASSIRNARFRRSLITTDNDMNQLESLYQEGVELFENALNKWEQATGILQHKRQTEDSDDDSLSAANRIPFYSEDEARKPRIKSNQQAVNGVVRSSSFSNAPSKKHHNNNLPQHKEQLDDLLLELDAHHIEDDKILPSFETKLQSIVNHAQHIHDALDSVLYDHSDTGSDTDMTLTGFDDQLSDAESESSASYVSAREFLDSRSIDQSRKRMYMYDCASAAAEYGEITCRTNRTELLQCSSDDDFLAKLHCVRQGFNVMFEDETVRDWLVESGRSMIECLLCVAERSSDEFSLAFTRMIDFVNDPKNRWKMEEELDARGVVEMNFYDIVLDFLLMDSFDDLEYPPGAVTSIVQNRWLTESLRESALSAAVWSVLKAKRSRTMYSDGFMSHLYDISGHVSPALAWGFLGPDGHLKNICQHFKSEVITFLRCLFSCDKIRYTSTTQMADDIFKLTRDKFDSLLHFLQDGAAQGATL